MNEQIKLTDAAEIAGCGQNTLNRAARLGHLKAIKKGKTWYTTREAIEVWMQSGWHRPNMKRR